jgi:hypothetical protein
LEARSVRGGGDGASPGITPSVREVTGPRIRHGACRSGGLRPRPPPPPRCRDHGDLPLPPFVPCFRPAVAQSNPLVVDPVEDVTPAPIGDSACARRTSAARVNPAGIAVWPGLGVTNPIKQQAGKGARPWSVDLNVLHGSSFLTVDPQSGGVVSSWQRKRQSDSDSPVPSTSLPHHIKQYQRMAPNSSSS